MEAYAREYAELLLVGDGGYPNPEEHDEPDEEAQYEPPDEVPVGAHQGRRTNGGEHAVGRGTASSEDQPSPGAHEGVGSV